MIRPADHYLGERLLELDRHLGAHQDALLGLARHTLAAFREIGLVGSEEADVWEGRLVRAAEAAIDRPLLAPEARAAARRHLERLVAGLGADDDLMAAARIESAIEALAAVGALSEQEAADWRERAFPDLALLPRCERTHLARVTRGPDVQVDGLRVTLVELYADAVSVNWNEQPAQLGKRAMRRVRERLGGDPADLAQPFLSDDVGTSYAFCGGGAGHGAGGRATIGNSDFGPAPPAAARSLVFESLGRRIRIPLGV